MERQDVTESTDCKLPPAPARLRAMSFPDAQNSHSPSCENVKKLAREVLALNKYMRDIHMPYVLQLIDTKFGTDISLMDKRTGLPCRKMAYDLISD